jgi:hypothetical protein
VPDLRSLLAYIGPGADMGLISYALTLVLVGLSAFSAIFLWPFYALLRRIRGGKNKAASAIEMTPGEASANSTTQP